MGWRVVLGAVCVACAAEAALVDGDFAATGSDAVARYFHAADTLPDGTVMASGGLGLQIFPPSLYSLSSLSFYDPLAGTWSTSYTPLGGGADVSPSLITARSSHTQTTLDDGRVLIAGGHVGASGTSPGSATASVEVFDPWTGIVTAGPSMNTSRAMHTATLLRDGRVLVAGGSTWQVFDPLSDSWTLGYALQRSRTSHAAVLLPNFADVRGDDRVLLVGGGGSGPHTIELLNPADGSSMLLAATLTIGVDDLAATRLPSGKVLIVGGQNVSTGDTVALTYLLDPVADTIAAGPNVPSRTGGIADHQLVRYGPYAVVLGGEQQLSGTDTILDYAAIFDGVTETWRDVGTMLNVHDDFAVAPLGACDLVIVGGGVPFFGQEAPSATCETLTLNLADACIAGDLDNDADVDADDLDVCVDCLTGPAAGWVDFRCWGADDDLDQDVDLGDVAALQVAAF